MAINCRNVFVMGHLLPLVYGKPVEKGACQWVADRQGVK